MLFYGKSPNKHETTYYMVQRPVVFTLDAKQLNICSFLDIFNNDQKRCFYRISQVLILTIDRLENGLDPY